MACGSNTHDEWHCKITNKRAAEPRSGVRHRPSLPMRSKGCSRTLLLGHDHRALEVPASSPLVDPSRQPFFPSHPKHRVCADRTLAKSTAAGTNCTGARRRAGRPILRDGSRFGCATGGSQRPGGAAGRPAGAARRCAGHTTGRKRLEFCLSVFHQDVGWEKVRRSGPHMCCARPEPCRHALLCDLYTQAMPHASS